MTKTELRENIKRMICLASEIQKIKIEIYGNIEPACLNDDVIQTLKLISENAITNPDVAMKKLSGVTFKEKSMEEKLIEAIYDDGIQAISDFLGDEISCAGSKETILEKMEAALDKKSTSDLNRMYTKYNIT